MADGHYFEVMVNNDPGYPQVLEILREVPAEELEH
jgi:hypothetical protein